MAAMRERWGQFREDLEDAVDDLDALAETAKEVGLTGVVAVLDQAHDQVLAALNQTEAAITSLPAPPE